MLASQPTVHVKSATWDRESHGLFDYESKNIQPVSMAITEPTSFYRKGQVIRCMSNEEPEVPADAKMLLTLNK